MTIDEEKENSLFYQSLFYPLSQIESLKTFFNEEIYQEKEYQSIIKKAYEISIGKNVNLPTVLEENLEDIFNHFKEPDMTHYLNPEILSSDIDLLKLQIDKKDEKNVDKFKKIEDYLKKELDSLKSSNYYLSKANQQKLLEILENALTYVPASNLQDYKDISLYDVSKLTAAFAICMWRYYKGVTANVSDNWKSEDMFLLASFDISGIQDFIYNVVTSGALKQLKARSLYLDVMSEYICDSLLEKLNLTRANLLYAGGGHAYFILPNTENTVEKLENFEKDYNDFLLEEFKTRLYVAFGWNKFKAEDMLLANNYREIYQGVSRIISDKKTRRYDAKILQNLNGAPLAFNEECNICRKAAPLTNVDGIELCDTCKKLRNFSLNIKNAKILIVTDNSNGLPVGRKAYLSVSEKEGVDKYSYIINDYKMNTNCTGRIFIGDYGKEVDISTYAQKSVKEITKGDKKEKQGIKRMGVVRLDVDDLGAAFMAGFNEKYNTFARTATFSRSMSRFFKTYINTIAYGKELTIVYAGGDDLFAIGTWQDIIDFTVDLRGRFVKWTNKKLTLSAGIGIFPEKTPVIIMARDTGDLEEAAKANSKDSLSLFYEDYTFKFDDFITSIYDDKLKTIKDFFDSQDERGNAFLYRLLELIQRSREKGDKIDIARLAYYLARLEDLTPKNNEQAYQNFKDKFFAWVLAGWKSKNKSKLIELECALTYYIYEIRKEQ